MIYPARGKYQSSYSQPHIESMAQYLAAVREPNTCVIVIGFGFNDDHLSEPMLAAVRSNPHLRLIVVDPSARKPEKKNNAHWKQLMAANSSGDDVWFVEATFEAFARAIPDLRSRTPAEELAEAVRKVSGRP